MGIQTSRRVGGVHSPRLRCLRRRRVRAPLVPTAAQFLILSYFLLRYHRSIDKHIHTEYSFPNVSDPFSSQGLSTFFVVFAYRCLPPPRSSECRKFYFNQTWILSTPILIQVTWEGFSPRSYCTSYFAGKTKEETRREWHSQGRPGTSGSSPKVVRGLYASHTEHGKHADSSW
jgi:hypothetical protein